MFGHWWTRILIEHVFCSGAECKKLDFLADGAMAKLSQHASCLARSSVCVIVLVFAGKLLLKKTKIIIGKSHL